MKTFEILVTRTTFEQCNVAVEAESLADAKVRAIAECEADDEDGQNFDWIISSGTEYQAEEAGADYGDGTSPASRAKKAEAFILAGNYEAGDAVCDILADLRHYCDANGLDFASEDGRAHDHYSAEVSDAKRSGQS